MAVEISGDGISAEYIKLETPGGSIGLEDALNGDVPFPAISELKNDLASTDPGKGAALVGFNYRGIATNVHASLNALLFKNIEEMKSAIDLKVGMTARTLGYYAPGDGGSNDYEIVVAGTGTDDGGSFIDLDNGLQARGLFLENYATPVQFGCPTDGGSDAGEYVTKMYAGSPTHDFVFTDGDYLFLTEGTCTRSNINTRCLGGVNFIVPPGSEGVDYAIAFRGQGSAGVTKSVLSITRQDGYSHIITSDPHGLSKGDFFRILSDDYFSGYDGYSGYEARYKGEFAQVRDVISSTEIRVLDNLVFDYSEESSKTIQKFVFAENIFFEGGNFIGPGGFSGDRPSKEMGIIFSSVRKFRLSNLSSRNMTHVIGRAARCIEGLVDGCDFVGPDVGDESNIPTPSDRWAKGFEVHSCSGVTMFKCRGENLRRILDVESFGSDIISTDCSQIGCEIVGCLNPVANHTAYRFIADGNFGTCRSGIALRSVDNTVINNNFTVTSTSVAIRIGRAVEPSGSEGPSMYHGYLECHSNVFKGDVRNWVALYGSFTNINISGLVADEGSCDQEALYVTGRHIGNITMRDCYLPVSSPGDFRACIGIATSKSNGIKTLSLGDILIDNCKFPGSYAYALINLGTLFGKGAGSITVTGCTFGRVLSFAFPISIFPSGLANYGTPGVHGGRLTVKGCYFEWVRDYTDSQSNPILWGGSRNHGYALPILTENWVGDRGFGLDMNPVSLTDLTDRFQTATYRQGQFTVREGDKIYFKDPSQGHVMAVVTKTGRCVEVVSDNKNIFTSASGNLGEDTLTGTPHSTTGIHVGMSITVPGDTEPYIITEVLNEERTSVRLGRPLTVDVSGDVEFTPAEFYLVATAT